MSWSMLKGAMRQEFLPPTLSEDLRHHLENTTQGCKPLDEYLLEMKQALQRAGEDDPAWMKHHFLIGLKDQSIIEALLLRSHNSLDDLYHDALMETSDDVPPSTAFIHGDGDEMVEHGNFPSTTAAYGDELRDIYTHIERVREFTTSPTYDDLPPFTCEECHHHNHKYNHYHLSDSTICDLESIHLEGVSEPPPHEMSEVVDRSCETIYHSNNITSSSIVSSPLVLGLMDDDGDHKMVFSTTPTSHERDNKGILGDGDVLVPLVDMDCMHYIVAPFAMPHAILSSTCFDLTSIYHERVMTSSCASMLHRKSCANSICHIMFAIPKPCHML